MSDTPGSRDPAAARVRLPMPLRLAVWTTAALGGAAMLYIMASAFLQPSQAEHEAQGPAGVSGGGFRLDVAQAAQAGAGEAPTLHVIPPLAGPAQAPPAPGVAFAGPDGKPVRVADFHGQVLVLNLWATWCAPCVKEMPTLAALAKAEAGRGVAVAAVSMDHAAATPRAQAFIARNAPLRFYQDAAFAFPSALRPPVMGFPTTLIYDKRGRLRATVSGDLDWNGEQPRRVLGKLAAEPA